MTNAYARMENANDTRKRDQVMQTERKISPIYEC